jgi:MFS family permease
LIRENNRHDDAAQVTTALVGPRYKWVVLSNTTIGVLLSTLNTSSLMIALPVIFRAIRLNPLEPANFPYLLWIMMGYMLVLAVVVVTVGRIGDIFGRVRIYNLGFAWFTVAAILLSITWGTGSSAAMMLIILRMFQAVGAAMLLANSAAIITDAFPPEQLGFALGINIMATIVGSFLGILVGGMLSQIGWRWVFLANVPIGLFATIWAYLKLRDIGVHIKAKIDWLGNISFAGGLAALLTGVTYGIRPYGTSLTGWGDPAVLRLIGGGVVLLVAFGVIETKVPEPMFRISLFRIRAFAAGNVAQFVASLGRGGFQFMLIIWFQGIWLPEHGYSFAVTPLWAGIYMIPWSIGFAIAGPVSGVLSDRYGARLLSTGGLLISAAMYGVLIIFPADFSYGVFAVTIFVAGVSMGMFVSPNAAAIMNSVPARYRGSASGMRVTFANAGMPLSMAVFFTLLVIGLNARVPATLTAGLVSHGVPLAVAVKLAHVPPLGYLFAAFLGINPLRNLLGAKVLSHLTKSQAATITGRPFFPHLIGGPFKQALLYVLIFALVMNLIGAFASALRGGQYIYDDEESRAQRSRVLGRQVDHGSSSKLPSGRARK